MKIKATNIEGVYIIKPTKFKDNRGTFFESFNKQIFQKKIDSKVNFVQDNQSLSYKGVLRGLHFQNPPYAQAKLVSVIKGSVLDVVVDLRKESKTFGKYITEEINEYNNHQLFIPVGMAHGFHFIAYCVWVIIVSSTYKWSYVETFWALLASILPFGTFVADKKIFSQYA